MKKVKEWFQEKKDSKSSESLFEIIIRDDEDEITTVQRTDGEIFSLGDYKIRDSKDIFTIMGFHEDLRAISFKTTTHGSSPMGDSMGTSLITDINLIDSDTIEYLGFLAKSQKNIQLALSKHFATTNETE
jgi:hypothetical protein